MRTVQRDSLTAGSLLKAGWRVAIVWECALDGKGVNAAAKAMAAWLRGKKSFVEFPDLT